MAPRRAPPPVASSDVAPDAARQTDASADPGTHRVGGIDYTAFDHLATLVAVVEADGKCVLDRKSVV